MRDNEHTAPSLGHSEILGIENAPGQTIDGSSDNARALPSIDWRPYGSIRSRQRSDEASKGVLAFGEDSWDVLPNNEAGAVSVRDRAEREREVPARVFEAFAEARDGEGLAGSSSDENIESCVWP